MTQLDLLGKEQRKFEEFEMVVHENRHKGPKRSFGPYRTLDSVFHDLGRFERKQPGKWRFIVKLNGGATANPKSGSTIEGTYGGPLDFILTVLGKVKT